MWRDREVLYYKYNTDNHKKMTRSNATSLIGAPSGAVAFNVQGSTLHHLLGIESRGITA
jgi:hypothetical protein